MNEIKRCSISGIGFTLELDAYNRLEGYLQSLKKIYQNNPDSEEILADIEARIAELILSAQSSANNTVHLPLIENIIAQLGTPEAISGVEESDEQKSAPRIPRRLYRDLENAKLGGVCAGLAKYFKVEVVWTRLALFSPLLLLCLSGIPFLWWCGAVGGNLFGIFILTYLILWFAIPGAKTARQKLEMEGEAISAQSIADRQGATQEEKAKSSVATAVTTFGKLTTIVLKIVLVLLLFPVLFGAISLIVAIIGLLIGLGGVLPHFVGEMGTIAEAVTEFGIPMMILGITLVLIPLIYVAYLFITLLLSKKPRWIVLLLSIIWWFVALCWLIATAVNYAEEKSSQFFSNSAEVERIMSKEENTLSLQIMESLDETPSAEQQAEIERLLNEANAQSIDR